MLWEVWKRPLPPNSYAGEKLKADRIIIIIVIILNRVLGKNHLPQKNYGSVKSRYGMFIYLWSNPVLLSPLFLVCRIHILRVFGLGLSWLIVAQDT